MSTPQATSSSTSFMVTVMCMGQGGYSFLIMPMTGRSTTALIWVMSRTVLARMPTAPLWAAALAISGMTPPSLVYSGSCSSAWQDTTRPPLILSKIS